MWLWQKNKNKNNPGGFVCVMQTGTHTLCFDDDSLVVGKTGFRASKRTEQKHCRTLTLWTMSKAPFFCLDSLQLCSKQKVWGRPAPCQPQTHSSSFYRCGRKQQENVECPSVKWPKFATGRPQGFGYRFSPPHGRAETVPQLVLDVFLDVVGTVQGTFREKTEQQLPN